MFDETPRAAHIQRCTYTEQRGGRSWQCKLTDPHPDRGHYLGIDAEFGRVLHEQRPDWLAGELRDRVALARHLQRRVDELQAIAVNIAAALAGGFQPSDDARQFLWATAPSIASTFGWDQPERTRR